MKERFNLDKKLKTIDILRGLLLKKYPKQNIVIPEKEKALLKAAIEKIQYPHFKHIIPYINEEIANLLAISKNRTLKEWGIKYKKFYQTDPMSTYVDRKTGIVEIQIEPVKIKQISPMHVAAAIGDIALIKYLMIKGHSIENNLNYFRTSPVEYAIAFAQEEAIIFIVENSPKGFKKVIERCRFEIIEILVKKDLPINDKILDIAIKRDQELYQYLNLQRQMSLQNRLAKMSTFNTLKDILNYPIIPIQSLIDLFRIDPSVIRYIENKEDGNTLLHQLVLAKERFKVVNLLDAIFQAAYKDIDGFNFDINRTNSQEQTLLDLVLKRDIYDHDMACIILMHQPIIKPTYKSLLKFTYEIDLDVINQTREKRERHVIGLQNQKLEVYQQLVEDNHIEMLTMKNELLEIKQTHNNLLETLEKQNKQLQLQQQLLDKLCQAQGLEQEEAKVQSNQNNFFAAKQGM